MKKKEKQDIDFEIRFYEGVLKRTPEFEEALSALGDLYTKKGFYKDGLEIDLRLLRLKPDDPLVLYNLACSYSLIKDTEKAYETIKLAVKCGYNDFLFLEKDSDLANLRENTKFKKFLTRIKSDVRKTKKKKV